MWTSLLGLFLACNINASIQILCVQVTFITRFYKASFSGPNGVCYREVPCTIFVHSMQWLKCAKYRLCVGEGSGTARKILRVAGCPDNSLWTWLGKQGLIYCFSCHYAFLTSQTLMCHKSRPQVTSTINESPWQSCTPTTFLAIKLSAPIYFTHLRGDLTPALLNMQNLRNFYPLGRIFTTSVP